MSIRTLFDLLDEAWFESRQQYEVLRGELERLMRAHPEHGDDLVDYADDLLESEDL